MKMKMNPLLVRVFEDEKGNVISPLLDNGDVIVVDC